MTDRASELVPSKIGRRRVFSIFTAGIFFRIEIEKRRTVGAIRMLRAQESAGRESRWMEIATATKPESGERERSKFDEVLAQMDEGAILDLREAAGFALHE